MICKCGGRMKGREERYCYVFICEGCKRRHEIPKEGPVTEMMDWSEGGIRSVEFEGHEIPKEGKK